MKVQGGYSLASECGLIIHIGHKKVVIKFEVILDSVLDFIKYLHDQKF